MLKQQQTVKCCNECSHPGAFLNTQLRPLESYQAVTTFPDTVAPWPRSVPIIRQGRRLCWCIFNVYTRSAQTRLDGDGGLLTVALDLDL